MSGQKGNVHVFHTIRGGRTLPNVTRQEIDEEPLLPTGVLGGGSLQPVHPDDIDEKLYPAGVGPAGRKPGEKRDLPPLMDS